MAHYFGQARIGRDAEIRTAGGDSVCNLSLAFSYYSKDAENGRATQWIDATFWGKRAEKLAPYLKKGGLVSVVLEDVHIEEYQGKNGPGTKLVGRVTSIELGAKQDSGAAPAPRPAAAPRPAPAPRPAAAPAPRSGGAAPGGFDDDSDIPFAFADYRAEPPASLHRRMRRYGF